MRSIFKMVCALLAVASFAFGAINLNTATKEELMSLNGIGASKADAIIEYRKMNKFQNVEDIKNVKGIGDKIYEGLKNDVSVSGASVLKDSASKKLDKDVKKETKKAKDEMDGIKSKTKDSAKEKLEKVEKESKKVKKEVTDKKKSE